jgi:hypothetical protein
MEGKSLLKSAPVTNISQHRIPRSSTVAPALRIHLRAFAMNPG